MDWAHGRRYRRAEPEAWLAAAELKHLSGQRWIAAETEARDLALGRDPDVTPFASRECQHRDVFRFEAIAGGGAQQRIELQPAAAALLRAPR